MQATTQSSTCQLRGYPFAGRQGQSPAAAVQAHRLQRAAPVDHAHLDITIADRSQSECATTHKIP